MSETPPTTPRRIDIGHPTADPGDGRVRCNACHRYVWLVIHSCTGIPAAQSAPTEETP